METGHRVYVVAPSEDAAVWYSACDLCKRSKRGCDRLLPSCTRCLHVGVECRYRDQKRDPRRDHHRDPRHAQPAATRTAMALDELRNAIAAQQNTAGFELAAALALAARIAQLHTGLMQVAACIPSPLDPSIPIPQQHILQQKPSQGQSSASVTTVNSLLPQQAPAFPFSAQSTPSPYASSSQNPEMYHAEWVMEDPDLMPTGEDWFLCHRYITPVVSLGSLLDPQSFLESFFREPPELRLSFCAIAAHCSSPRLPDATCNAYYMRARKAISRSMQHHPTVKTVQSLEMLSSFAFSSGQPLVGNRYFFSAVKLSLALRLNVDPDSLIECIQLTEVEREDRRLTFWVIYYTLKMIQIVNGKPLPVTIPTHNVKPAKEFRAKYVETVHPEFQLGSTATVCYISSILDVIHPAVQYFTAGPPESALHLLLNPTISSLTIELQQLKSRIPATLLLDHTTASLTVFTRTFKGPILVMDALVTTLYFHAGICALHRPQLYLTHFLDLARTPTLRDPRNVGILLTALEQSLAAARTITELAGWLLLRSPPLAEGRAGMAEFRRGFWKEHAFACFALFEAAVVLWFATTRTREVWWSMVATGVGAGGEGAVLEMGLNERRRYRGGVLDVLQTLHELEAMLSGREPLANGGAAVDDGGLSNMVTPMVAAVFAMVEDMRAVEEEVEGGREASPPDASLGVNDEEAIVIGMKVLALSEDGEGHDIQEVEPLHVAQPWVFLPLLGVAVNGNLRWNAPCESGWRDFWEKVSM